MRLRHAEYRPPRRPQGPARRYLPPSQQRTTAGFFAFYCVYLMTELDHFWPACLARLEAELSSQQFNTWIKPLAAELTEDGVQLLAPNRFIMQFIKDRFLGRIEELAVELMGEVPVELRLGSPSAAPVAAPAKP